MAIRSFPFDSKYIGEDESGFPMGDRDATSRELADYQAAVFTNGYFNMGVNPLRVSALGGY